MCLRSISRSLELRKNMESNLKSHLVFYFCKKISGVQNSASTVGTNLKKYISLKKAYILIFYVSNINFKKPRIEEKYWIKFKKSSGILFLQKGLGCPELGENGAPLKTHLFSIPKWFSNSNKTLNSCSWSEESHTSFDFFF